MALRHLHRVLDHFRSRRRLGKIRNPHNQAAPALLRQQDARRSRVIGFGSFRSNLGQTIYNGTQVKCTTAGCEIELNGASISKQANAVPALRRDLRQRKRRVDGVIQLRNPQAAFLLLDFLLYFGAQQTTGIEHNPDGLAALHFKNTRREVMPPRRRCPANVANVVTLLVIAQAFELAAVPALAAPPTLHFNLAAADQIKSVLASLLQVGKYPHCLRNLCYSPSLRES